MVLEGVYWSKRTRARLIVFTWKVVSNEGAARVKTLHTLRVQANPVTPRSLP